MAGSVSTVHKLDRLSINAGAFIFDEIDNFRMSSGMETLLQTPAAHITPLKVSPAVQNAVMTFDTPQIDLVATNIPHNGLRVSGDTVMYLALGTATGRGTRASLIHKDYTLSEAMIYWTRINLPLMTGNSVGLANIAVVPVYDGSNEPIVPATSQGLVGSQAAGDNFGVGPCSLNTADLPGIQNLEIVNNAQLLQLRGASDLWPTFVGLERSEVSVIIRMLEAIAYDTYGFDGTALSGSAGALTGYARKANTANGTTEHVSITHTNGHIYPVDTSGGQGVTTDTLRVDCVAASDTGLAITLTDGVAIT